MKTVFYSLDTEAPSLGQNRFEYFCSVKLFPTPLNEVSKGDAFRIKGGHCIQKGGSHGIRPFSCLRSPDMVQ